MSLPLKSHLFLEANKTSPVVYMGCDAHGCVYRLLDGQSFNLTKEEAKHVGVPRFAHLEAA